MYTVYLYSVLALLSFGASPAFGQSSSQACQTTLTPTKGVKPSIASGFQMALVATGLNTPRSIQFDTAGNLLVAQENQGIEQLSFQDDGGTCLHVRNQKTVVDARDLNHGLALSPDGRTLYASSPEAAFSWPYDAARGEVTGPNTTLITGMENSDHTTRTLLASQKVPGLLLVSRGSKSNVDLEAESLESGHSQIKAFDTSNMKGDAYDFNMDGMRLGWGLRNSVGVAEHPITGGIYSVENSVDEIMREGKDVHQDNPGEEMNFHGYLNGTDYPPQGSNYGYPYCFAAWTPEDLPQNDNIKVGSNFAMGNQNDTVNDTFCAEHTPPRLTFQAHMAPLDLKWNNSATEGWVSFHGSWDRDDPVGYKVSMIPFNNGEPVDGPDSKTAAIDIFGNQDNSKCPQGCLRPVGIAFDQQGRMFVSSDATGEIYVVMRDTNSAGAPTPSGTSTSASTSPTSGTSDRLVGSYLFAGLLAVLAAFLAL